MESGRLISSAGGNGGQVLLFGGGFQGGAPMAGAAAENGRRKRSFLTFHDELQLELGLDVDDVDQLCGFEYELQGAPAGKAKRRLTAEQVKALEVSFEEDKRKLEPERKSELSRRLGIAPRQVAVWFQNRRARWRAKQLEQDFERLRAAHDELLAGRDALVADNDRLRSQVIALTEKLQAKEFPVSPAEEQIATSAATTATPTPVEAAVLFVQLDEDPLCEDVMRMQGVLSAGRNNGDSPESSNFAGAPSSPPLSSEGDFADESSALLLPDAATLIAEEDSWERFWNWG